MGHTFTNWEIVWSALEENAEKSTAKPMSAYMRHRFPFLGIKTPQRRNLAKNLSLEIPDFASLRNLVELCFQAEAREAHYVGLDILEKNSKLWTAEVFELFEKLIQTHSWWDSIDRISSPLVWKALGRFPDQLYWVDRWSTESDFWLQRTALLYQRTAKEKTDKVRLARYIEQTMENPEFFLRKAIGWALRQYGYTDPQWVREFVTAHPTLSALSVREATRALPDSL